MIVKSIRPEVLTATRTAYWLAIDDAPEEQLVFIDKSSGIRVVERDRLAARVGRGTAATIARAGAAERRLCAAWPATRACGGLPICACP